MNWVGGGVWEDKGPRADTIYCARLPVFPEDGLATLQVERFSRLRLRFRLRLRCRWREEGHLSRERKERKQRDTECNRQHSHDRPPRLKLAVALRAAASGPTIGCERRRHRRTPAPPFSGTWQRARCRPCPLRSRWPCFATHCAGHGNFLFPNQR